MRARTRIMEVSSHGLTDSDLVRGQTNFFSGAHVVMIM